MGLEIRVVVVSGIEGSVDSVETLPIYHRGSCPAVLSFPIAFQHKTNDEAFITTGRFTFGLENIAQAGTVSFWLAPLARSL